MADREEEEEGEQSQQEGPGGNATAVDAISERLAEVAELAERLDAALCAGDGSVRRIIDSENWGSGGGDRSDDDFLTASECTCTRSSSFHTASECGGASGGGAASPSSWWEEDQSEDQPQHLVTTSVEERQGVIVHEVTETRTLKLSHSPSFGITSYHMTHEITDSAEPKAEKGASSIIRETLDGAPPLDIQQKKQEFEEKTEEEIKLEEGLKEPMKNFAFTSDDYQVLTVYHTSQQVMEHNTGDRDKEMTPNYVRSSESTAMKEVHLASDRTDNFQKTEPLVN